MILNQNRSWLLAFVALSFGVSGCWHGDDADAGGSELGFRDPTDPPALYCAALCGDGECIPFSGEDCTTCLQDCGAQSDCSAGRPTFGPGATSLDLGDDLVAGCRAGNAEHFTLRHRADRGVREGAAPLPFKEGARRVLTMPAGCGGVADDEGTEGEGVSLRDGTFGLSLPCFTVGPNAAGIPVELGLRYETGRWNAPDPSLPQNYARPGSPNVSDFWFVSYSRRLDGAFPPASLAPWTTAQLPPRFTLHLEDYTAYQFELVAGTLDYVQPGTTVRSAVATARIATEEDSNASCAANFGNQLIAPNDVIVQFPDGGIDVFSGRDLSFKGHIDNDGNQLVVSYRLEAASGPSELPVCHDESDDLTVGVKRIASIPAGRTEPLFWVDLRHVYDQQLRAGDVAPRRAIVETWRLAELRDSLGRSVLLDYTPPTALGDPLAGKLRSVTYAPGRSEQQVYAFDYDEAQMISTVRMPTPYADAAEGAVNEVTLSYSHPVDQRVGGLSRVVSQTRRINGVEGQVTRFDWRATNPDLVVTYPDGLTRSFEHETSRGAVTAGMDDDGADRVTAVYNLEANVRPSRIEYDPVTGFVTQRCDPLGDPETGARCARQIYDADLNLSAIETRTESGGVARSTFTYESFGPPNNYRVSERRGPVEDDVTIYSYETTPLLAGAMTTVRVVGVTDALAQRTQIDWCTVPIPVVGAYCPIGRPRSVLTPQGAQTRFLYDAELGTPARTILTNGAETRTRYDARGCLLSSLDVHGVRTDHRYDDTAASLQFDCQPSAQIRNPTGTGTERLETRYVYGSARDLLRVIEDADGVSSNANAIHDLPHRIASFRGELQPDLLARGGDGEGFISLVRYRYDVHGRPIEVREPTVNDRTVTTTYSHAPTGTSEVVEQRSGIEGRRVSRRDAAGQVYEAVDERGVTTRLEYDRASGRVVSTVEGAAAVGGAAPAAITTRFEHEPDGLSSVITHADGVVESFEYDALRRVAEHRSALGDDVDRRVSFYDRDDRVVRTEHYAGVGDGTLQRVVESVFEGDAAQGPRVREQVIRSLLDPAQDSRTAYGFAPSWDQCAFGAPLPGGGRDASTREAGGCWAPRSVTRPRQVSLGEGAQRSYAYDALGRIAAVTERAVGSAGEDASWTHRYDGLGCLRESSGGGRTQTFVCDRLGRTTVEQEGTTGARQFGYYADNTLSQVLDFDGTTTFYDLDATSWRLGGIRYVSADPTALAAGDVSFAHEPNDLVRTVTDSSGVTTYAYDSANRMSSRARGQGGGAPRELTYGYAPGSRRLARRGYWGRGQVQYAYDTRGQVRSLTPFGGDTQEYGYRTDGLLESIQNPGFGSIMGYGDDAGGNGVASGRPQLTSLLWTTGPVAAIGEEILDRYYLVDASGNIESIIGAWGGGGTACASVREFRYDAQDRLTTVNQPAISCGGLQAAPRSYRVDYDARGNVLAYDSGADSSSYPISPLDSLDDRLFSPSLDDRIDTVTFRDGDSLFPEVAAVEGVRYDSRGNLVCYPETPGACDEVTVTPTPVCSVTPETIGPRPRLADPCPLLDPAFDGIDEAAIDAQVETLIASSETEVRAIGVPQFLDGDCAPERRLRLPVPCDAESLNYRVSFLGGAVTEGGLGGAVGNPQWNVTSAYLIDGEFGGIVDPIYEELIFSPGSIFDAAAACQVGTAWTDTTPLPRDGDGDSVVARPLYCRGPDCPAGQSSGPEIADEAYQGCFDVVRIRTIGAVNGCIGELGYEARGSLFFAFEPLGCTDFAPPPPPPTGRATRFVYDDANRLRRITTPDQTVELEYDGLGNLAAQTITEGGTTRRLGIVVDEVGSHARVVGTYDRDVSADPGEAYVYGPAGLAAVLDASGSLAWAVTERLGSVVGMIDGSGNLLGRRDYDARGELRATEGRLPPIGFTGEFQTSDETLWLRARHYHAGIGRFLQRDSWAGDPALPQTLNRYAYAVNNPLSYVDPSGLSPESPFSDALDPQGAMDSLLPSSIEGYQQGSPAEIFTLPAERNCIDMPLCGAVMGTIVGGGPALKSVGGFAVGMFDELTMGARHLPRLGVAGWRATRGTIQRMRGSGRRAAASSRSAIARSLDELADCNCFEGDTLVSTDEGLIPIREVVGRMGEVLDAERAVADAEAALAEAERRQDPNEVERARHALAAAQESLAHAPERLQVLSVPDDDVYAEPTYQDITHVYERSPRPLLEITLQNERGERQTLRVTPTHRFWVEGRGWVAAQDLLDDTSGDVQ